MIFAPLAKTIDYVGQFSIQVPGRDDAGASHRPQRGTGVIPRLFTKAPPPPTLAERIGALPAAPADVLAATALGIDTEELRVAAVQLLPDGEPLRTLAGLGSAADGDAAATPPAVRHAAEARLARLIDNGAIEFAAFAAGAELQPQALAVVALCQDPERLREVLGRITDQRTLARVVVDGRSSHLRQLAATAIDDPAVLGDLIREVRGKDKTAYRIIQQKCDALTAVYRHAEEATREGEAVAATLERHATKPYDVIYGATLEVLTQRWSALASRPLPEIEERGRAALERCREVIAVHDRELARQAAEHAAREAADREAREARERAGLAEQQRVAEQAETDALESAAAAAAREAEEKALWERRAAEEQAQREIAGLIRLAREALKAGNSRKAARFRQSIEEAAKAVAALPVPLAKSLEQLDGKLNELRQWKDYVAAPKRIELIEEMEALAGSQEEPAALAERIRALQQEWRTINKGIASDASADTERFQHAYQLAFKPCQEYFAAQAAERRKHLAQRVAILERLKAVELSQQAEPTDHTLLLQVLREAPREWRGHSPVDGDAARPVEIEFHRVMDRLRKRLNAWYEANEKDKQALIAQARQLSTLDDSTAATDGVKRLQSLWKDTGPASREHSERLWTEFRALCDAAFKKREQAYAAQSVALGAAKVAAVALCEEVERMAATPATERAAAKAKIAEWRAAVAALGELPRGDARGLNDRFERAVSRYEAGLAQQDRQDAESAVSNLVAAARHIGAYERALARRAEQGDCDALRAAAEAFIAAVPRWPKGGLAAAKQALARATASLDADDGARERTLRMLCIRCEILSSTPTPAEDEALRREYQLRLLMQSMGQAAHADDRDWDALLLEWVAAGGAPPAIHEALEGRFLRCLAKRPAKSSAASPFQHHDGRDRRAERERRDGPARSGDRGTPRGSPRR